MLQQFVRTRLVALVSMPQCMISRFRVFFQFPPCSPACTGHPLADLFVLMEKYDKAKFLKCMTKECLQRTICQKYFWKKTVVPVPLPPSPASRTVTLPSNPSTSSSRPDTWELNASVVSSTVSTLNSKSENIFETKHTWRTGFYADLFLALKLCCVFSAMKASSNLQAKSTSQRASTYGMSRNSNFKRGSEE